ncbi:MAG: reverse transcriptase domain-containing protein [Vagococcus fluvialis]
MKINVIRYIIKPYSRIPLRQIICEITATKLKPMYIVRYADDFKIFTNNRSNAEKIFKASQLWLEERLKLPISTEKSKVTNLKKEYSEFLGFKLKARKKGTKRVSETHIADKALKNIKLKQQIKTIQKNRNKYRDHR